MNKILLIALISIASLFYSCSRIIPKKTQKKPILSESVKSNLVSYYQEQQRLRMAFVDSCFIRKVDLDCIDSIIEIIKKDENNNLQFSNENGVLLENSVDFNIELSKWLIETDQKTKLFVEDEK